jgi:hypothetical protein
MERRRILHDARIMWLAVVLGGLPSLPTIALADESGVSFWLPGLLSSFAAAPRGPGWTLTESEYYDSARSGGGLALAKEVQVGHFTTTLKTDINGSLIARENVALLIPSYTFEQSVLGGQASVQMLTIVGKVQSTVQGNIAGSLGPLGFSQSGSRTDSAVLTSDLFPAFNLRWNAGLNNFMTYIATDVPLGYDASSLANLSIGHYAIDGGGAYTYLDSQAGNEFSAIAGVTYNFVNPYTDYRNGVDFHFDWGASHFLTKQLLVGAVGYVYHQLTGDSGSGDQVGSFMSRVVGVGPQIGYFFPLGGYQGYLNLKGYGEFDAHDRASGYNAWLTLTISSPAPTPVSSASPRTTRW